MPNKNESLYALANEESTGTLIEPLRDIFRQWSNVKRREAFLQLFDDIWYYFNDSPQSINSDFDYKNAIRLLQALSNLPLNQEIAYQAKSGTLSKIKSTLSTPTDETDDAFLQGLRKALRALVRGNNRHDYLLLDAVLLEVFYRLIHQFYAPGYSLKEPGEKIETKQPALIQSLLQENWSTSTAMLKDAENKNAQEVKNLLSQSSHYLQESLFHIVMRYAPTHEPLKPMIEWLGRPLTLLPTSAFLGQNPLHVAVYNNHTDWLSWGLKKGLWLWSNSLGQTPLHVAALMGHADCVKVCLDFPNYGVNAADNANGLVEECRTYQTEILKQTPLHMAFHDHWLPISARALAQENREQILGYLLSHENHEALLNVEDCWGLMAHHYALMTKQVNWLRPFVDAGANFNHYFPSSDEAMEVIKKMTVSEHNSLWSKKAVSTFPVIVGKLEQSTAWHFVCQSPFMPLSVIRLLLTASKQADGKPLLAVDARDAQGRTGIEALLLSGCSLAYQYAAFYPNETCEYLRWLDVVLQVSMGCQGAAIRAALAAKKPPAFYLASEPTAQDLPLAPIEAKSIRQHWKDLEERLQEESHIPQVLRYIKAIRERWHHMHSVPQERISLLSAAPKEKLPPRPVPVAQSQLGANVLLSPHQPRHHLHTSVEIPLRQSASHSHATSPVIPMLSYKDYQTLLSGFIAKQSGPTKAYYDKLCELLTGQLSSSLAAMGNALSSSHDYFYDYAVNLVNKSSRTIPLLETVSEILRLPLHGILEVMEIAYQIFHGWEAIEAGVPKVEKTLREWVTGQKQHFKYTNSALQEPGYPPLVALELIGVGLAQQFTLQWSAAIKELKPEEAKGFAEETFERFIKATKTPPPPQRPQDYLEYLMSEMLHPRYNKAVPVTVQWPATRNPFKIVKDRSTSCGLLARSLTILLDDKGNAMVYAPRTEDLQRIDAGELHEANKKYANKYNAHLGHAGDVLFQSLVPVSEDIWKHFPKVEKSVGHYQAQFKDIKHTIQSFCDSKSHLQVKADNSQEEIGALKKAVAALKDSFSQFSLPPKDKKKKPHPSAPSPKEQEVWKGKDGEKVLHFAYERMADDGDCGFNALGITRKAFLALFYRNEQFCLSDDQVNEMADGIISLIMDDELRAEKEGIAEKIEDNLNGILFFLNKKHPALAVQLKQEIGNLLKEKAPQIGEMGYINYYLQKKDIKWKRTLCEDYLKDCLEAQYPEEYQVELMSNDIILEGNKLYVELGDGVLKYTVVDLRDNTEIEGSIDLLKLEGKFESPLTVNQVQPYLTQILEIASESDHIKTRRCWLSKEDVLMYAKLTQKNLVIWDKKEIKSDIPKKMSLQKNKDYSYVAKPDQEALHLCYGASHFDRLTLLLVERSHYFTQYGDYGSDSESSQVDGGDIKSVEGEGDKNRNAAEIEKLQLRVEALERKNNKLEEKNTKLEGIIKGFNKRLGMLEKNNLTPGSDSLPSSEHSSSQKPSHPPSQPAPASSAGHPAGFHHPVRRQGIQNACSEEEKVEIVVEVVNNNLPKKPSNS